MQFHYQRHQSLPSPPQQHQTAFAHPPAPGYKYSSARNAHNLGTLPLSPPASDEEGLMSPPSRRELDNKREYDDKVVDYSKDGMWLPTSYNNVKPGMAGIGPHSPPIQFIEDILQQEDDEQMHEQHLQQHRLFASGYEEHALGIVSSNGNSNPLKRQRGDDFMLPSPYSSSAEPSSPQSSSRHKKKRQLTEASEATWTCEKCGKHFSRIWNYNAHLETHNPDRPRPHTCPYQDCGKAFVRKTDLTRHTQCVHAKDKKFQCDLCGNTFARKDTLRRHEDDGCPQRVDIISRHSRNNPLNVHSQALSCFLGRRESEQQMFLGSQQQPQQNQQQQQYDCHQQQPRNVSYDTASFNSCLPPLSGMVSIQKTASWGV
ncbi:hypothetical protein BZA05DRAFT_341702 [Tricharina praecox]|uniref:uncharacterized protein n=1 Tax=Tricharina praecox TaxID=43433 RepID=UPI002220985B|nr:uncharacterized protein BZA05DRAFT_341702 [Tricharina praecox]KAI5846044.1 hypothetical protein BZA05DRAFT_341702 [Tricharina praecox]